MLNNQSLSSLTTDFLILLRFKKKNKKTKKKAFWIQSRALDIYVYTWILNHSWLFKEIKYDFGKIVSLPNKFYSHEKFRKWILLLYRVSSACSLSYTSIFHTFNVYFNLSSFIAFCFAFIINHYFHVHIYDYENKYLDRINRIIIYPTLHPLPMLYKNPSLWYFDFLPMVYRPLSSGLKLAVK